MGSRDIAQQIAQQILDLEGLLEWLPLSTDTIETGYSTTQRESFCFNLNVSLYEGGVDHYIQTCTFCRKRSHRLRPPATISLRMRTTTSANHFSRCSRADSSGIAGPISEEQPGTNGGAVISGTKGVRFDNAGNDSTGYSVAIG